MTVYAHCSMTLFVERMVKHTVMRVRPNASEYIDRTLKTL